MPNWCTNTLTVSGEKKALAHLLDLWEPRNFQSLVPMPKDEESQVEQARGGMLEEIDNIVGGDLFPPWYHWRLHNWGTKWDIEDPYEHSEDNEEIIILEFDTAWSPPEPFVERVAKKFPLLTFDLEYYELGNGFAGQAVYSRGEQVEKREGSPEEFDFCSDVLKRIDEDL